MGHIPHRYPGHGHNRHHHWPQGLCIQCCTSLKNQENILKTLEEAKKKKKKGDKELTRKLKGAIKILRDGIWDRVIEAARDTLALLNNPHPSHPSHPNFQASQ